VMNAMFNVNNTKTLIKEFDYPRLGPGMMWERFAEAIAQREGEVHLNAGVVSLSRTDNHINSITVRQNGETREVTGEQFISSMPVTALVQRLDPPAPDHVLKASRSLNYRAFIIVPLVINDPHLFPDNWIYIHSPEVRVGRIQNFKNWSPEMVPDAGKTCLGMEYFCDEGDALWNMSDTELLDLATKEVAQLGLAKAESVEDGCVIRQPKAYPVYDRDYRDHLQVIQDYIDQFDNLQTTGRNGMHRYNNQDHSMLTGYFAARNLMGESHDLWDVNAERSYHESFSKEQWNGKEEAEKAVVS
jgi:protoporphyrinogen oxidase